MHFRKPFLWGLLLCLITFLVDGLVVNGIAEYIKVDKSFFQVYLWNLYLLCLCILSMAMSLLVGNVPGIRIQVLTCFAFHALMWILLLYNYSHDIRHLTTLRIVTTEVANTALLFLFIRKKVSPLGVPDN